VPSLVSTASNERKNKSFAHVFEKNVAKIYAEKIIFSTVND
jgi:hypothetical protein